MFLKLKITTILRFQKKKHLKNLNQKCSPYQVFPPNSSKFYYLNPPKSNKKILFRQLSSRRYIKTQVMIFNVDRYIFKDLSLNLRGMITMRKTWHKRRYWKRKIKHFCLNGLLNLTLRTNSVWLIWQTIPFNLMKTNKQKYWVSLMFLKS